MKDDFLAELARYVGFTEEHAHALAAIKPRLEAAFPGIVDRFYDAIMANPHALAVFTGGRPQIERQKTFLAAWLQGLFSGRYDAEYLRTRARIGRTHVRIRLDQRYVIAAMNIVRHGLHEAVRISSEHGQRSAPFPVAVSLAHQAIDKICDIELAIMLQSYAEDYAQRIRDNERLATLGQLAGFVGHELRNPLAVMETSLHLLRKRLPPEDAGLARHSQRLGEQLTICANILSSLLDLARDRPVERAEVAVGPALAAALDSMQLDPSLTVTLRLSEELPPARVDEKQLRQVLVNLVSNAAEAVADQREKCVAVQVLRDGDTLVLTVDDSGPGIAEELRTRLFEPLATTRPKGLGLGLALCRRIVEKHGGDIRALRSELGGARFELRFPHAFQE